MTDSTSNGSRGPRLSALCMGAGARLGLVALLLVPLWLAVWWSLA
jgi:hypothetical protein